MNLEGIVDVMTACFGPRPNLRDALPKWTVDPTVSIVTQERDGRIVAVCIVRLANADKMRQLGARFGLDLEGWFAKGLGDFQTIAVLPEYRRDGLAEMLCRDQLAWLVSKGCKAAIGVAWQHGGQHTSEHLFRKAGFETLGVSTDFYTEERRAPGRECPVCGPECHCRAVLYAIDIERIKS